MLASKVQQGVVTPMHYAVPPATTFKAWSSGQGSFSSLLKGSRAAFSHSIIYGQDKLRSSIIRGVADTPTKSQGVKTSIWVWSSSQSQFWMVKILDRGHRWNCIVYSSDYPLYKYIAYPITRV